MCGAVHFAANRVSAPGNSRSKVHIFWDREKFLIEPPQPETRNLPPEKRRPAGFLQLLAVPIFISKSLYDRRPNFDHHGHTHTHTAKCSARSPPLASPAPRGTQACWLPSAPPAPRGRAFSSAAFPAAPLRAPGKMMGRPLARGAANKE